MGPKRRQTPPPCPCRCAELAGRLERAEALNTAIIRTLVTLRPIARHHSTEAGLTGWGARPEDARLLAAALQQNT